MRKLIQGEDDFETWCISNNHSQLLREWDPSNDVFPSQVSHGSHRIVKWKCSNGHFYEKDIHSRSQGIGCPFCSRRVFVHRKGILEEYPNLIDEVDTEKNSIDEVSLISCCSKKPIHWICKQGHSYSMNAIVKSKSKGCPICNNKRLLIGENDLETWCKKHNRTQILDDWDYDSNSLVPREILPGSNRTISFKCHICGYKWKTTLISRTLQHTDCRMCSRRMSSSFPEQCVFYYISLYFPDAINGDISLLEGKELDVWVPSLNTAIEYDGREWHKDTNRDVTKDHLCKEKGIILYRIREKGCLKINTKDSIVYEYDYQDWYSLSKIIESILCELGAKNPDIDIVRDEYTIKEKYYKKTLENSLQNSFPEIAKEWHPTRNKTITPDLVSAKSNERYYWLCPKCDNVYRASVHNRVGNGSGCPICSRKKAATLQMNKVINLDTGEIFNNTREAAIRYNTNPQAIGYCCRGTTKTSGGYRWAFYTRGTRSKSVKNDKQQAVVNLDTGEEYASLNIATQLTGIHNISACCRGVRKKAGGYRWGYLDSKEANSIEDMSYLNNHGRNYSIRNKTTGEVFNTLGEASNKYGISIGMLSNACRGITKKAVAGCYWEYTMIGDNVKSRIIPVICVETGVEYESIEAAKKATGASQRIAKCCKNPKLTSGGFHWKYKE